MRTEKVKIGTADQVGRKGSEYESSDIEKCMSPHFRTNSNSVNTKFKKTLSMFVEN